MKTNKLTVFMASIAREEGWYISSSRCRRNHNPGNIVSSEFTKEHGELASDGRFAIFKTDEDGFNALEALLKIYVAEKPLFTVADTIAKWAPPSENNTGQYLKNVCEWGNVKPTNLLADIISGAQV